jgi:hypothetical protein
VSVADIHGYPEIDERSQLFVQSVKARTGIEKRKHLPKTININPLIIQILTAQNAIIK